MILKMFSGDIKLVRSKLKTANEELTKSRYREDDPARRHDINFAKLAADERDAFEAVVRDGAQAGKKYYASNLKKIEEFKAMLTDTTGSKKVDKLDALVTAIKIYLKQSLHKWLFVQAFHGVMNPYFVEKITHEKGYTDRQSGRWIPPVTKMQLVAFRRNSQTNIKIAWRPEDLPATVPELFTRAGLFIETEAGIEAFQQEFKRYMQIKPLVGVQMNAEGEAQSTDGYSWKRSTISMIKDGRQAKVVIDDQGEEDSSNRSSSRDNKTERFVTDTFWKDIASLSGMAGLDDDMIDDLLEEREGEPNRVELPIHPYLKVFDLQRHEWLHIHSSLLSDYEWDAKLIDKLVINDDDKTLISMLMTQTGEAVEDIVRGKMSGVIVLATGQPGIGKTLTAEVFSETIQKPLYNVQCSQLGIEPDKIESNLEEVLDRASRWGAILLIDEADVYIRSRGEDIQQNAIVGVFLRLIEYYRGVLFMTSNRGEVVDDAIISRATAWIKYKMPTQQQLLSIWRVLAAQYKVTLSDDELLKLTQKLPNISGRTVRNLLKLARMLKPDDVTVDELLTVSKYQDIETSSSSDDAATRRAATKQ